ncbi:MAG TPA: glycerol-3-phosphate dehydrogenase, partial [Gammaproteobacteria bacterium]|nr:glycerol-3-phosphate dehydrogenase [Gammaproteobacteria bacterium]
MTQDAFLAHVDILIVGGGINGAGIARDAAGRGLEVALVEQGDLASATSSASSKLVHGGLRYLEHGELRLVAEALREREVLLRAAPHIVRPMRFVLPEAPGQRPAWVIRAGLLAYDWLARRQTLAASKAVSLREPPYGSGLRSDYSRGWVYSDCWVDDSRLVLANARSAHDAGASIMPRTAFLGAQRRDGRWRVRLRADSGEIEMSARVIVNAAGPWAGRVLDLAGVPTRIRLRLVQGSHIVVPRLYDGDHAFILQNDDGRVVFVYAYEGHTLVGTTDVEIGGGPDSAGMRPDEAAYLCHAANRYFEREVHPGDVLWSYCGVRTLVDDGASAASRVTRDYVLDLDGAANEAPLLSVLGGKITTHRALAERAMDKLAPWFPGMRPAWTANAPLPGGDAGDGGMDEYLSRLKAQYAGLPDELLRTLLRRHGTATPDVIGDASRIEDFGEHFGAQLYAREVAHFRTREWAR